MDGYHRLGALMSTTPTIAIFRRYSHLNVQNLLWMQAEINELEQDLQDLAWEDKFSGHPEREKFSREWWRMAHAQGADSLQWRKWLEIRSKLDNYSANSQHHRLGEVLTPRFRCCYNEG